MVLWVAGAALAGAVFAQADDDLAVVKKAVSTAQAQPSPLPAEAPAQAAPPARRAGKAEPQWLRVRVLERDAQGETRKRVSVNLPLSLVRAMDDLPIDLCHRSHWKDEAKGDERRCEVKVGDVLAALEAGQELVEVEGEDATVKVWVE
jgi:hypothetical protein